MTTMVHPRSLSVCLDGMIAHTCQARSSYRQMVHAACKALGPFAPRVVIHAYRTVRYAFWSDGVIVLPASCEEYWQQALYLLMQHILAWWQAECDLFLPFSPAILSESAYDWHRSIVRQLQHA